MSFVNGEQVGPYRIIERLGQGGMSTVFKAYHPSLDRYVALKVLHPMFKGERDFLERFQREARIVARLEHPHIVPVYDFSEHEDTPYLVMRYVEGRTLKAVLGEAGAMSPQRILETLHPVCAALEYAHGQGVLHRDVKPSNILLSQEGKIYVTDFGLARMVQGGDSTISQDRMIGTPQYISPEQAKGDPLDHRTDLYSLGVVLFEMLTGKVPYTADTPFAVVHDHIFSPLPLPSSLDPGISTPVERVVLKALAKDPNDRYQSAGEFLQALERAVQESVTTGDPARATPLPPAAGDQPGAAATVPVPVQADLPGSGPAEDGSTVQLGQSTVILDESTRRRRVPLWVPILGVVGAVGIVLSAVLLLVFRPWEQPQEPVLPRNLPPRQEKVDFPRLGRMMPPEEARTGLQELERQLGEDPHNPGLHLARGNALYDMRQWAEAEQAYHQALKLDPENIEAHHNLGAVLLSQDRPQEAIGELQPVADRTVAAEPWIFYNLGMAYAMTGQRPEAMGALGRFLELYPTNDLWRGQAEEALRRLQEQE